MANAPIDAEVAQQAAGLPQLNVIADGTFTNQIAWLVLTFLVLFFIVSKLVLPRITRVIGEREETIADDLDTAERLNTEAEDVKESYEASLADARSQAQKIMLGAKEAIQKDAAKSQARLDKKLNTKAAEAEAAIAEARAEALKSLDSVAAEVAADLVAKLGGSEAKDKAVKDAVKSALNDVKGA